MRTLLACVLLAAACHPARPPAAATSAAAPANKSSDAERVRALLTREQPSLSPHDLALPDGGGTVSIESAAAPTLEADGKELVLTVPIGTTQPVVCRIAPQVDLASTLQKVFKVMDRFPKHEIVGTDAGEMSGQTFLSLSAIYLVEPQRLLGELTLYTVRRDGGRGALCTHDEPGYQATVKRVVASVAASPLMKGDKQEGHPLCRELVLLSMAGRKLGVISDRVTRTADGRLLEVSAEASLQITTPTEFQGSDRYEVTHSRGGIVEDSLYVDANGTEQLELQLTVEREKAPPWYHVHGLFKGKQIDTRFQAPDWFSSERKAELVRTKILGSRGAELKMVSYTPGTDPTAVSHELVRSLPDGTYEVVIDERLVTRAEFDPTGRPTRASAKMASQELVMERIFQEGKCP